MKVIDLLNKIAKGEIKEGFRIKSKAGAIYEYKEGKDCFYNIKDPMYVYSLGDFTKLNTEIEIIEEKPKKIEELEEIKEITQDCFDNWTCAKRINQLNENQKKIIKAVNYLLEKESDK